MRILKLGLLGTSAALALAIALVVDALTDPMMGSLSDNFRSRWGRRHPFMVGGALPLALRRLQPALRRVGGRL